MREAKTEHLILGISLVMIGMFMVLSLVLVSSQASSNSNMTLNITGEPPTVTEEHLSASSGYSFSDAYAGNINDLTPGVGKTIYLNGRITDPNGWANVTKVFAQARRSDRTALSYASPTVTQCSPTSYACYPASTDGGSPLCTLVQDASDGDGLTAKYECAINLGYYASYTSGGPDGTVNGYDWRFEVLAVDAEGDGSDVSSVTKEVNAYLGLGFPGEINFGTKSLGDVGTTAVGTENVQISQAANDTQDAYIYATNMACAIGSIPVANMQYGVGTVGESSDVGYGGSGMANYVTSATSTTTVVELNVPVQTTGSAQAVMLRNEVTIPSSGIKGPCSGTVTIVATSSR